MGNVAGPGPAQRIVGPVRSPLTRDPALTRQYMHRKIVNYQYQIDGTRRVDCTFFPSLVTLVTLRASHTTLNATIVPFLRFAGSIAD